MNSIYTAGTAIQNVISRLPDLAQKAKNLPWATIAINVACIAAISLVVFSEEETPNVIKAQLSISSGTPESYALSKYLKNSCKCIWESIDYCPMNLTEAWSKTLPSFKCHCVDAINFISFR
jgi:hypothetical protein